MRYDDPLTPSPGYIFVKCEFKMVRVDLDNILYISGLKDYVRITLKSQPRPLTALTTLKAIEEKKGLAIYNLGTGHGYSVLDVVKAFEKVNGLKVPYVIKPRRPGDIATCYCDPAKAKAELGWEAKFGIEEMCRDSWNFQKNNPNGYEE